MQVFLLLSAVFLMPSLSPAQESGFKDDDRIVFIGDSITGQGANGGANGWIALIGEGLELARPDARPTLIGLGGSGATVGAWLNFEERSRTEPVALDVKEIDVGETLDAGTDIAVFMLGMNDVLAPSLNGERADYDAWIVRYGELIEIIRERSKPRIIALATVTPCTEDPTSPKNLAITELNQRLATLAREKISDSFPPARPFTKSNASAAKGRFILTGPLDHAKNIITLTAIRGEGTLRQTINIPAGWRIATGRGNSAGWFQNSTYDPEMDRQEMDATLALVGRESDDLGDLRYSTAPPAQP